MSSVHNNHQIASTIETGAIGFKEARQKFMSKAPQPAKIEAGLSKPIAQRKAVEITVTLKKTPPPVPPKELKPKTPEQWTVTVTPKPAAPQAKTESFEDIMALADPFKRAMYRTRLEEQMKTCPEGSPEQTAAQAILSSLDLFDLAAELDHSSVGIFQSMSLKTKMFGLTMKMVSMPQPNNSEELAKKLLEIKSKIEELKGEMQAALQANAPKPQGEAPGGAMAYVGSMATSAKTGLLGFGSLVQKSAAETGSWFGSLIHHKAPETAATETLPPPPPVNDMPLPPPPPPLPATENINYADIVLPPPPADVVAKAATVGMVHGADAQLMAKLAHRRQLNGEVTN